jgi:uncharacterized membrane protein YfcA
VIGALVIGLAGGVIAGLMGVGGGVLFVPGLVLFLGLSQQQAEATSLLAIVPVAIVGALSHDRRGNVRRREGLLVGLFALAGASAGVVLANSLSAGVLRIAFAVLLVVVAGQLVREAHREQPSSPDSPGELGAGPGS